MRFMAGYVPPLLHPLLGRDPSANIGGYLLISVSPSVRRPHCVAVNADTVRYPLREGTHKRYLAESEIADMYRSRFTDARTHADQAHKRHEAMVESLDRSDDAW